jgi:arginase family enzyme
MGRSLHVIGFPWEEKSTLRRGSMLGPWAIRRHLIAAGLLGGQVLPLPVVDEGVIRLERDERAFAQMGQQIDRILDRGGIPLALGGDHSITLPVVRSLAERYGPVRVVWVDRHADLHPDFLGDRWSHACVAARLLEAGCVLSLWQAGVQELDGREKRLAQRWGVAWTREPELPPRVDGAPLYLSIDLDVLDPKFAPGASAGCRGGWSPEELLRFVADLSGGIVGADVVELNPRLDRGGTTAKCAAELVLVLARKVASQWSETTWVRPANRTEESQRESRSDWTQIGWRPRHRQIGWRAKRANGQQRMTIGRVP